jgi:hypothetical protein
VISNPCVKPSRCSRPDFRGPESRCREISTDPGRPWRVPSRLAVAEVQPPRAGEAIVGCVLRACLARSTCRGGPAPLHVRVLDLLDHGEGADGVTADARLLSDDGNLERRARGERFVGVNAQEARTTADYVELRIAVDRLSNAVPRR